MTPQQKIKHLILAKAAEWEDKNLGEVSAGNVDELYDELVEADGHWDAKSEIRSGDVETGIPCDCSRHYESRSVWNGHSPAKAEAWSLWTVDACADLAALKTRWADVIARRTKYLSELDEAKFNSEMFFQLLSGDPSSMLLAHQMQHVVNHATLHRGQVVGMIRQLGIEPPSTDMIFYLRSDISPK